ncbi:MAG: DUF2142 domain-containing protein [Solirubrobacteraceae bacterium]
MHDGDGGAARRRPARVPRPLAALLVAVALLGFAWALLVPPWQAPDEPAHFAYVQSLGERFALPGDRHRQVLSTSQLVADSAVGASRVAFHPDAVTPDWSAADNARFRRSLAGAPSTSDGGGINPAEPNPPAFYLYSDLAYWVAGGGADAFDQLYAMRIWDVALLLTTVVGGWLLAGEVFARRRRPQLVCAAVCGLIPGETFIATSVNPDALMVALWSIALWLGTRVILRGAARRDSVALGLVTATAVLTKATSYALVPAVLAALVIGWRRRPAAERPTALSQFGPPLLALAGPVLAWLVLASANGRPAVNTIQATVHAHAFNVPQFLSYLWQFYLPRLPVLTPLRETSGLPLYDVWVREGWGVFGWLDVEMPRGVYYALAAVSGVVAIGAAGLLLRIRERRHRALLAFFALATAGLLFGLHLVDYRAIIAGQGPVIQGRYLLPVVSLVGLAFGLVISRVPLRWRGSACGAVLAGLLLVQVLALATILKAYYT